MKIKKIFIIRYGPLQNLDLDIGPGLQVIWGRNEAGKTLTIDAITKMMLEGKVRDFDRINRVEEEPEGFILFEDTSGKEIKVSVKKGLVKHISFAGLDLRNIFVIRDSDLTLKQECGYYKSITDRLTGMNLEKIEGLISGIKDYGRLTRASSEADLSDNKDYGKIASLTSTARSFISDSMEYVEQTEKQKYDFLELDQLKIKQDISGIRKKIEIAEKSQNWDKYRKISQNLDLLKESWKEYQDLKDFNQANYVKMTEIDLELDSMGKRIDEHKKDLEKNSGSKALTDEKIMDIQARSGPMEKKKTEIDRVLNKLEIHNQRKSEEAREIGIFPKIFAVILLLLVPASFLIVYFPTKNILLSFILPVLFFIGSIAAVIYISRAGRGKSKFKASGSILESEFRKLGFKVRGLDDIIPIARVFEEQYYEISQKKNILKDQARLLDTQISEVSTKIKNDENRRRSSVIEKEKFFSVHNIYSIEQFREKLRMRSRAESNIISGIRNMADFSGTGSVNGINLEEMDIEFEKLPDKMDGLIEYWRKETGKLKPPDDPGTEKDTRFDPGEYSKLKSHLLELQDKEDMYDRKLDEHRSNLNDFQRRFSQLNIEPYLRDYNDVNINALEKLREASGIAGSFIEIIEGEYNISIEALKIFEDIKSQEETKISDLFEKLGVSSVFEEITEGKYTGVNFDSNLQSVKVIDKYEIELEASKLSKGAYDQLFLAIRIAIAEEMLGEGKGFFIMDDAFLASDSCRIKNQFKILKKLADRGWSIVYFSVKDEVRDLAAKFSKNKVIEI